MAVNQELRAYKAAWDDLVDSWLVIRIQDPQVRGTLGSSSTLGSGGHRAAAHRRRAARVPGPCSGAASAAAGPRVCSRLRRRAAAAPDGRAPLPPAAQVVFKWRLQAEEKMRASGKPGMTDEQVGCALQAGRPACPDELP